MSQKSRRALLSAFQVVVDQALDAKTIHELWEKMELLTSLTHVFAKSPERETLIKNSKMKSLWDVYLKMLKSEYLDFFYVRHPKSPPLSASHQSEEEMVKIWKNFPKTPEGRNWDPWILGVFFNPMFWFQDYRRFFDKTHCDEFNQYIKNVFQTLRVTTLMRNTDDDTFRYKEDAEECAVFDFCDYIVHDIEVMDNCHIMPTKWEYEDAENNNHHHFDTEKFWHKEARLQYTTPNHEKRQILCLITNIYNEEPVDTKHDRAAYWKLQYDYSQIQIFDSDKFNEQ